MGGGAREGNAIATTQQVRWSRLVGVRYYLRSARMDGCTVNKPASKSAIPINGTSPLPSSNVREDSLPATSSSVVQRSVVGESRLPICPVAFAAAMATVRHSDDRSAPTNPCVRSALICGSAKDVEGSTGRACDVPDSSASQ